MPVSVSLGIRLIGFARHGRAYQDEETGVIHLSLPERMRYMDVEGIIEHPCNGSETPIHLAFQYYRTFYRWPSDLHPVICNFQPEPILNPLAPIPKGRVVLIPPIEYIETVGHGDMLIENPALS